MQIGSVVGPYRIVRHLGSGSLGSVWLANDRRLHRPVALKVLRAADADGAPARAQLMRKAGAAAVLSHPHIAHVYDVVDDGGQVVIVFEYVEGETLDERLAREPVPTSEAIDIGCQIAKALEAAHAHGIAHRDLKPANVMVSDRGHVTVLDFGIARLDGAVRSAAYAAPEQMVSSAVDERADLYALGVILFEMIGGRHPFVSDDPVKLVSSRLGQEAPLLATTGARVPRELERLVASLLARERDQRPSAADVVSQLRVIDLPPITAGATTILKPKKMVPVLIAIATLGVLVALAVWGPWQRSNVREPVAPREVRESATGSAGAR